METFCPLRITTRSGGKLAVSVPESRLRGPAGSGVKTNRETRVVFAACDVIATRRLVEFRPVDMP